MNPGSGSRIRLEILPGREQRVASPYSAALGLTGLHRLDRFMTSEHCTIGNPETFTGSPKIVARAYIFCCALFRKLLGNRVSICGSPDSRAPGPNCRTVGNRTIGPRVNLVFGAIFVYFWLCMFEYKFVIWDELLKFGWLPIKIQDEAPCL